MGICCMAQETQTGEGDEWEFQREGDTCILMADSC